MENYFRAYSVDALLMLKYRTISELETCEEEVKAIKIRDLEMIRAMLEERAVA